MSALIVGASFALARSERGMRASSESGRGAMLPMSRSKEGMKKCLGSRREPRLSAEWCGVAVLGRCSQFGQVLEAVK